MIILDKSIKLKKIKGKRIKSIIAPFPLSFLFSELVCVINDGKLYFENATVSKVLDRITDRRECIDSSGSIDLADIVSVEYIERNSKMLRGGLCIKAGDYCVECYCHDESAAERIMKELNKEEDCYSYNRGILDIGAYSPARSGIWADICDAFYRGELETLFDSSAKLEGATLYTEEDFIILGAKQNNADFFLVFGDKVAELDDENSYKELAIAYETVASAEEVFAKCREFILENI